MKTTRLADGRINVIYQGYTAYVNEDSNPCVSASNARSLLNTGYYVEFLEKDPDIEVRVVDFNLNSITVDFESKSRSRVPVRLWEINEAKKSELFSGKGRERALSAIPASERSAMSADELDERVNSYYGKISYKDISDLKASSSEDFSKSSGPKRKTYRFGLGKILEFGQASTTIMLQDAGTRNLMDAYSVILNNNNYNYNYGAATQLVIVNKTVTYPVYQDAMLSFNFSANVPSMHAIDDAELCLNMSDNGVDANEWLNVSAYLVYSNWSTSKLDLTVPGNTNPTGLFANDSFWWVVDGTDNRIYRYNRTTGGYHSFTNMSSIGNTGNPSGIDIKGSYFYLTDNTDDEVYEFVTDNGNYTGFHFDTAIFSSNLPFGITHNESVFFIADPQDARVYIVNFSGYGSFGISFDTSAAGSNYPAGIFNNGSSLLVSDTASDQIYVFSYTGTSQGTLSYGGNATGPGDAYGIWGDSTNIYLLDYTDIAVYNYTSAGVPQPMFPMHWTEGNRTGAANTVVGAYVYARNPPNAYVYSVPEYTLNFTNTTFSATNRTYCWNVTNGTAYGYANNYANLSFYLKAGWATVNEDADTVSFHSKEAAIPESRPYLNVTYSNYRSCLNLTQSVVLGANIATTGTCFEINTSSVELDCGGFNISGKGNVGVNITNAHNIIVKNCVFVNFSKGIYAHNALNLTLINNTFVNATNYGIFLNNSAGSNITAQIIRDSQPLSISTTGTTTPGTSMYGIYLYNVSSSNFTSDTILRLTGGVTTNPNVSAGSAYGVYLDRSHINSFQHLYIKTLTGATAADLTITKVGTNAGGSAYGLYLSLSNNSAVSNLTVFGLTGGNGGAGTSYAASGVGGTGGTGGSAKGAVLSSSNSSNFTFFESTQLIGGNGGQGGSGHINNGGPGGTGGSAAMADLSASYFNNFFNLTFNYTYGGLGGNGGDSVHSSGAAGASGGSAYSAYLSTSRNNTFDKLESRGVFGGAGGSAGLGGIIENSALGGDAIFLYLLTSNNNSFSNARLNYSVAGTTCSEVDGSCGIGAAMYFSSTNFTAANWVYASNVSGGEISASSIGVYFSTCFQNTISNSTIAAASYLTNLAYSVYVGANSQNNVFVNATFNRSGTYWDIGTSKSNFTVKWYTLMNITDLSNAPISGASISFRNATGDTIGETGTSDSNGLSYHALAEYIANGTHTYGAQNCTTGNNIVCYSPFYITASKAGYSDNASNWTINVSQTIKLILELSPQSATGFTLTLPGQAAVWGNGSAPPDANQTAMMNFTMDVRSNLEGTQANVVPCVGNSATDCQAAGTPFFQFNNTGTAAENWYMRTNATLPAYIRLKCNDGSNLASGAYTIANNTFNDWVKMNNAGGVISVGETVDVWCWADFTYAPSGSTGRRLEHNTTGT